MKVGIIGIGNMGTVHAESFLAGKVAGMELHALCDTDPKKIEAAKAKFGESVKYYDNDDAIFSDKAIDVMVIATPHYQHPELSIRSLKSGFHTMCEKPAGVFTSAVAEMNAAAEKSDKLFGIMFNQRTTPIYQKLKELIDSGELGGLKRMTWIATDWYRSQSYHDSGGWRSTWEGEGGGALINQCPHQLDLWQWIFGMPKKIRAFCSFGKYHNIEVEDDLTAYAEYENGMTATYIASTGEAPGTNRLEVAADMGKVVVENGQLTFWRNRISEREFDRTYTGGFGMPECRKCEISAEGGGSQHIGIFQNFADAILKGGKLLSPGYEGIKGLTLSNAIHLSAWTDTWVELPIDEALYYEKLQERIKNSTYVKKSGVDRVLNVWGTH